jgi:hypothetical protein
VRLARAFGQKHGVDVWHSEAGRYRLLEVYRPRTSPRARVPQVDESASENCVDSQAIRQEPAQGSERSDGRRFHRGTAVTTEADERGGRR